MEIHSQTLSLNLTTPIGLYRSSKIFAPDERIYLLLHGYNERAKTSLRRFGRVLPEKAAILSPHGPYPLPERKKDYWRVGYAWYFYDSFKEEYLISPDVPAQMLAQMLKELAPHNPLTVIGYSQGAYLAPYLAQVLENCDHVILCNGVARSDLVHARDQVRYDALNATMDQLVNFERAQDHFNKFAAGSKSCHFHPIVTSEHELTPEHYTTLAQVLALS